MDLNSSLNHRQNIFSMINNYLYWHLLIHFLHVKITEVIYHTWQHLQKLCRWKKYISIKCETFHQGHWNSHWFGKKNMRPFVIKPSGWMNLVRTSLKTRRENLCEWTFPKMLSLFIGAHEYAEYGVYRLFTSQNHQLTKISPILQAWLCTFQISVQDFVSHIQTNEWNNTTVSKWSVQNVYTIVRLLWSKSYSLLTVPKSHTAMYGEKSLRASPPRLWNKLPNYIKPMQRVKNYFAIFLNPTYLNYPIYNIINHSTNKMCLCYEAWKYLIMF